MPIIVEQGRSGACTDATLRAMFEDRKKVFVDLLKWGVPVLDGRFEIDGFDNSHATYIIIADDQGDHLGSARLLPTTRAHILNMLFAELCAGVPPTGPAIAEITRFCLSPRRSAESRRRTRNQLITALTLHALGHGIHTYTGVAELTWLQQILAFGWDCRPLGVPLRFECGIIAALAIEIRPNTPELLAANRIWDPPVSDSGLIPQAA